MPLLAPTSSATRSGSHQEGQQAQLRLVAPAAVPQRLEPLIMAHDQRIVLQELLDRVFLESVFHRCPFGTGKNRKFLT